MRNGVEDKDRYLIVIKQLTYQKVIKIINIYVSSDEALMYRKQKADGTEGRG